MSTNLKAYGNVARLLEHFSCPKKHHRQSQTFYFNHQQWWDKPDQGCKDKLRQDASRWVWRGGSAEEVEGPMTPVVESQVWMALTRRSWNDKLAAWWRLGHGVTLKAHECSQSGLHRRWQSGHAAMLHYGRGFWLFSWPWAMPTKTIERRQAGRNSIQTSRCGINREVCIFEVPLLYQSQEGVGWHGRPLQSSRFGPDGPGGTSESGIGRFSFSTLKMGISLTAWKGWPFDLNFANQDVSEASFTLVTSKPASYSHWWYLMAKTRIWSCGKSIWVHSSIAIHSWLENPPFLMVFPCIGNNAENLIAVLVYLLVCHVMFRNSEPAMSKGKELRAELAKKTKRTSMPNIFIAGEGIGGHRDWWCL